MFLAQFFFLKRKRPMLLRAFFSSTIHNNKKIDYPFSKNMNDTYLAFVASQSHLCSPPTTKHINDKQHTTPPRIIDHRKPHQQNPTPYKFLKTNKQPTNHIPNIPLFHKW
jgi:hypothetical protein